MDIIRQMAENAKVTVEMFVDHKNAEGTMNNGMFGGRTQHTAIRLSLSIEIIEK
jgi:hypothetical protein